MRGVRCVIYLVFAACSPFATAPRAQAPDVRRTVNSENAPTGLSPSSPNGPGPSSDLSAAIAAAVASAPDWPRPVPDPVVPATPTKPDGHLAHPVCVGPINLKKDPPHRAACCYPVRELIVRPIRAVYPALRACYDARKKKDTEGRVVFDFRIEQDGSIPRVCTGEATSVDDEDAVRCMVEVIRTVRYPSMSDEERAFCGLMKLNYPVVFEP